eukprot:jgi/Mesen1/7823/ME000417S07140
MAADGKKKRVLFVCSHNSNRSIAAEVIARQDRPDLNVASAGVDSAGKLNPRMIEALKAHGYATDGLRSKSVGDSEVGGLQNKWDFVFTMGCLTKGLPEDPPETTKVDDWGLPDPAADPDIINDVIEGIKKKVRDI